MVEISGRRGDGERTERGKLKDVTDFDETEQGRRGKWRGFNADGSRIYITTLMG